MRTISTPWPSPGVIVGVQIRGMGWDDRGVTELDTGGLERGVANVDSAGLVIGVVC